MKVYEKINGAAFWHRAAALPGSFIKYIARPRHVAADVHLDEVRTRAKQAFELTALAGRELLVRYAPGVFLEVDDDALGYLFTVALRDEIQLTLDARTEDLRGQLARELRRAANAYQRLAEAVEESPVFDDSVLTTSEVPHA